MAYIIQDIDSTRQEIIDTLVESPQNFDEHDIATMYCIMTGRNADDYSVEEDGTIKFF